MEQDVEDEESAVSKNEVRSIPYGDFSTVELTSQQGSEDLHSIGKSSSL